MVVNWPSFGGDMFSGCYLVTKLVLRIFKCTCLFERLDSQFSPSDPGFVVDFIPQLTLNKQTGIPN